MVKDIARKLQVCRFLENIQDQFVDVLLRYVHDFVR